MNKLKKWFKGNITTTDWIALFILLLAVVGIFYLPHWVTQKSWKYDLGETESNEIADTIGGILGPFISFISACLVYLALREQVKANKLIHRQFELEKKGKFEREIYQEVLIEIDSVISNFKKFDGSSLKKKINNNDQPITYSEFISELFSASIYENYDNLHDQREITLFINNFNKIVDSLMLFIENVREEKAFLQIIKRRIDKIYEIWNLTELIKERNDIILKYKYSSILKLSKLTNFELIVRLLQVEKKLLQEFNDKKLEIVSKQLEWYEKQYATLSTKLSFERKLKAIYTATFINKEERIRDFQFNNKTREEYEKYTTLLETEKIKIETDFRAFLLQIKALSLNEGEVKYFYLDDLIGNLYQTL